MWGWPKPSSASDVYWPTKWVLGSTVSITNGAVANPGTADSRPSTEAAPNIAVTAMVFPDTNLMDAVLQVAVGVRSEETFSVCAGHEALTPGERQYIPRKGSLC